MHCNSSALHIAITGDEEFWFNPSLNEFVNLTINICKERSQGYPKIFLVFIIKKLVIHALDSKRHYDV